MLPVNNYVLDFKTSCTREEAVGKMLGWLRGPIRWDPEYISTLTISEEYLTYLPVLAYSLKDHFGLMREAAINEVISVFDNPNSSESEQKIAADALFKCDELINKAAKFINGIDDEIAKGAQSALRVDQQESDRTGELHITLKSLDDWATQNYQVSILESESIDKESLIHDIRLGDKSTKKFTQTTGQHLYTTFAFLIDAYAKTSQKFSVGDDINKEAIANRLEQLATEANRNIRMKGQSAESIKDRIEDANKIRKAMLPSS